MKNTEVPAPKLDYIDEAIELAQSAHDVSIGGATVIEFPRIAQMQDVQVDDTHNQLRDKRAEAELTLRTKAALVLGGIAATMGLGVGMGEVLETDFEGEKIIQIEHDTVSEIAVNEVEGGASSTGATIRRIVEMNPDVFQNGRAFVESEDIGKDIKVPESVN